MINGLREVAKSKLVLEIDVDFGIASALRSFIRKTREGRRLRL